MIISNLLLINQVVSFIWKHIFTLNLIGIHDKNYLTGVNSKKDDKKVKNKASETFSMQDIDASND